MYKGLYIIMYKALAGRGFQVLVHAKKDHTVRWRIEKILPSPHPKGWGCGGRTFPVAVPDQIIGLALFLDLIDCCHSLRSLNPPPAALPSLPTG